MVTEDKNDDENNIASEPQQPKFTIGGAATSYSDDDSLKDELPAQQTTVRALSDTQDGDQVQVIGLQYQPEKQEAKTYVSESELKKKDLNRQKRMSQLKIGAIITTIVVILLLVGWLVLSSAQQNL